MRKSVVIAALSAAIVPLSAGADDFNPQPDPPGKMLVSARFAVRSIDDPDIRKITLTGQLRCSARVGRPSKLGIQLVAARFTGHRTRQVSCTLKRPADRRSGGSWSGEVVGQCNGKPAVARIFVVDDVRGGGDVELVVTSSVPACAITAAKPDLLGRLTARMVHDIDN